MARKNILIIAGPNGAGKTTFALTYLRAEALGLPFLNADMIAAGLAPMGSRHSDVMAGRLMLAEIDRLAGEGRSFAFETTLSGRGYLRRIDKWRAMGYRVSLVFLSLQSPDEAIDRVRRRVAQGGHNIPEDVVRRRFNAGLANLRGVYAEKVDSWVLYNNTGRAPILIEMGGWP